jgi:sulfur-carrier protein
VTRKTVRVVLPAHLRTLARVSGEVALEVEGPLTLGVVLDALEARFPVLRGTMRDAQTLKRRAMVRFFACQEDWSHAQWSALLPPTIAEGSEALLVVGAIAGG